MMKSLLGGVLLLLAAMPAKADPKFDVARMSKAEAEQAYRTYSLMLAAIMNCEKLNLSAEAIDKVLRLNVPLLERLNLSTDEIERRFEGPAWAASHRHNASFCKRYGPQVMRYVNRVP